MVHDAGMSYPSRPVLEVLPQFLGTNLVRQSEQQRRALMVFAAAEYRNGRSLREIAELTGRTQTAVRRALDEIGVPRRGPGAPPAYIGSVVPASVVDAADVSGVDPATGWVEDGQQGGPVRRRTEGRPRQ